MSHGHSHHHGLSAAHRNKRALTIVFVLTAVFLAVEVAGGLISGSLALLADAGHMLTDVGGVGLALLAIRFAERPATPKRTYGFYRSEILAALANSVILIFISIYILYEAYHRLVDPPPVQSTTMLAVAALGLIVNIVAVFVLRSGSKESLNLKAAYYEVVSDMFTSVGVIIGGLIILTTGWYYADPLISVAIGLFILPRTWALLRDAVGILLEGTPSDVNIAELRKGLGEIEGVAGIHDLHVWSLTSGVNAMSVHVVISDAADHDDVRERTRAVCQTDFSIAHTTIQTERLGCEEDETHL